MIELTTSESQEPPMPPMPRDYVREWGLTTWGSAAYHARLQRALAHLGCEQVVSDDDGFLGGEGMPGEQMDEVLAIWDRIRDEHFADSPCIVRGEE